jgi:excisionase family DNA binding protein
LSSDVGRLSSQTVPFQVHLFVGSRMNSAPAVTGELLTVREVARRLALSERTVWRWAADGLLPAPLRLRPRSTRWRAADIQRYLEELTPRR